MSNARAVMDAAISESEFMRQIIDLATMCGWLVAHIPDALYRLAARHGKHHTMAGAKGLPDLILAKPGNPQDGYYPVVFLECKTETGRVRPEQREWLEALDVDPMIGDYVVARVVRPSQWDWIESLLTGGDEWRKTA